MIKTLNIKSCCVNNAIPLAFDESLSYLEELSAILEKLNEVVIQVNSNTEFIENYESEYDELKREMAELIVAVNTRFNEIERTLQNDFTILTNRVINLIDDNYNILKAYIDEKYDELDYKIEHITIDSIILRDPTTGTMNNIQVVINNLFNALVTDSLTASEYDALDLTATNFDAYQITAYEFDTQGKLILI